MVATHPTCGAAANDDDVLYAIVCHACLPSVLLESLNARRRRSICHIFYCTPTPTNKKSDVVDQRTNAYMDSGCSLERGKNYRWFSPG